MTDPWDGATPIADLAVDHIGIVVANLEPTLAWLRARGFRVSDGEPLMGDHGPLGQVSAHCVFENGYVEISAPIPGSGNHLEPLLARGEGIRILALASRDAAADHLRLGSLAAGPPRLASRTLRLAGGDVRAQFCWFPLSDILPGVISAVVEHRDRPIVFARELREHPNGAHRMTDILLGKHFPEFPREAQPGGPVALMSASAEPSVAGFSVEGAGAFLDRRDHYLLRGLP
jgi:catechol 2,3-dioxygenase-like lactoylglutathione lyase family enzyme